MITLDKLEKMLLPWLRSFPEESFPLERAVAEVQKQITDPEDQQNLEPKVRNLLDAMDGYARTFHGSVYYDLERFMHGVKFLCRPRPFEIQEGILIPGVRFEPFHPDSLFADDLEITADGKLLTMDDFTAPYDKVSELYFLLGPSGTLDMFNAESGENYDKICEAGGLKPSLRLNQTVFKMAEFYQANDFRSGDALEFTLDSYMNGTMTVRKISRADLPGPETADECLEQFEEALAAVCRDYKDSFEIPVQLLYAYLYAYDSGRDLRQTLWLPIDEYHTHMRRISFRRNGAEWTLADMDAEEDETPAVPSEPHGHEECSCGHDHAHGECDCGHDHGREVPDGLNPGDFSISGAAMESLSAILLDVKSVLTETELRALMMDAAASGVETFSEFGRINEDVMKLEFKDDVQEAAFLNFAEDLWEYTMETYSPNNDSLRAPLRQRLLELLPRLRETEAFRKSRNDTAAVEKLHEIHRAMIDTFAVLDADTGILEDAQCEDLELRIGDLEDAVEDYAE